MEKRPSQTGNILYESSEEEKQVVVPKGCEAAQAEPREGGEHKLRAER